MTRRGVDTATEFDTTPVPPLVLGRDYLKAAHEVISQVREGTTDEDTQEELDSVLNGITNLLLELKAVGSDSHWAR